MYSKDDLKDIDLSKYGIKENDLEKFISARQRFLRGGCIVGGVAIFFSTLLESKFSFGYLIVTLIISLCGTVFSFIAFEILWNLLIGTSKIPGIRLIVAIPFRLIGVKILSINCLEKDLKAVAFIRENEVNNRFKQNIQFLQTISGRNFEKYVAQVFQERGYLTSLGPGSNDGGIDVSAKLADTHYIVQCKARKEPISLDPIRSFATTCRENSQATGLFISLSGFSRNAQMAAERKGIVCWDVVDLLVFRFPELNVNQVKMSVRHNLKARYYATKTKTQLGYMKKNSRSS